jgi:hypothetical protein
MSSCKNDLGVIFYINYTIIVKAIGTVNNIWKYTLWTLPRSYFKGISDNIELQMYTMMCCWPYLAPEKPTAHLMKAAMYWAVYCQLGSASVASLCFYYHTVTEPRISTPKITAKQNMFYWAVNQAIINVRMLSYLARYKKVNITSHIQDVCVPYQAETNPS